MSVHVHVLKSRLALALTKILVSLSRPLVERKMAKETEVECVLNPHHHVVLAANHHEFPDLVAASCLPSQVIV